MKRTAMRALFAAAAVVAGLSLASCSGDLHEELAKEVIETDAYTPSIASEDEISFFYKTSEQDDYYVWAWDGTNGGDYFTGASWPGAAMELMGSDDDGAYIYKYVFSVTTAPAQLIISHGAEVKIYDGVDYVNHGLYDGGDTPTVINKIATEEAATPAAPSAGSTETPASGSGDGTTETPSSGSEPAETPSTGGGTGSENAGSEEASSGTEEGGAAETPAAPVTLTLDDTFVAKGDFDASTGFALEEDEENTGVYAITVEYRTTMSGWGGGNGSLHFKLNSGDTWYGYTQLDTTASTELPTGVTITQGASDEHIVLNGLSDLTIYTITFALTEDETAIVLGVAEAGTFEAPAAPTNYEDIEAEETAGNAPVDNDHTDWTLDETTGTLYTVTGIPSWYGNDGVCIWAIITDTNNTSYWKRVKFDSSEGTVYLNSGLTLTTIKTRRYNADLTEFWNGSGSITVEGTVANCTKTSW